MRICFKILLLYIHSNHRQNSNILIYNFFQNELKCTIKEKISVSTKKFAKQNDIAQIVRFFNNLLNGLTVYGFNDKMINLKDDELARNWAMVHIIDTYLVIHRLFLEFLTIFECFQIINLVRERYLSRMLIIEFKITFILSVFRIWNGSAIFLVRLNLFVRQT